MHRRLSITVPEEAIRLLDRLAKRGDRRSVMARAVERYVEQLGRENLQRQLKEGALRRKSRYHDLAEAWFALECRRW